MSPNVSSDLPSVPVTDNKENLSYSCSAAAQEWVLDSGAKPHYTNFNHNLTSVSLAANSSVTLADGSTCKVYGTGQVFLHTGWEPLKLTNVRFAPEFEANLMSVSELTAQGFKILFEEQEATLYKESKNHAILYSLLMTSPSIRKYSRWPI